jgi:integrase
VPRSKQDGTPAKAPNRQNLTELYVRKTRPRSAAVNVWDLRERGLVLRIQPSGHRAFKFVYSIRGRARWYHIGQIPLSDARRMAAKLRLQVAEGKDPLAERRAERGRGSFEEVHSRYLEQHAKKRNRSWAQADSLVRRFLLPRWGDLELGSISRADVRQLVGSIPAPVVANQTLAAASAVFSWAVKQEIVAVNPCTGVERHELKSRERVLADSEVKPVWDAMEMTGLIECYCLRTILLTGQRPGEVAHMRREHVADGWWTLPGNPDPKTGWPGTKNGQTHRVWLPEPVRLMLAELADDEDVSPWKNEGFSENPSFPGKHSGFVFPGGRGNPISKLPKAMQQVCAHLGIDSKITPHDLRRTHGSTITRLGFGRDAMNRIQNHREGGIADVYDRHEYADENKLIMEKVAGHILKLAKRVRET